MEKRQKGWWTKRSKSLSATQILLFSTTPLFIASSALVSIAAPQKIAQVNPADSISRPTLKVGSQGERVSELQAALRLLGFYSGEVDGIYSENTATAVSRFKQAAGLNPDGIVDATTWQRLFPRESVVGSTVPASGQRFNSATNFPVPTQASSLTNVGNPNPNPPRQAVTPVPTKPNPPKKASTQATTNPKPPKKAATQATTSPKPPKKAATQTATSPEPRPANPRQAQKTPNRTTSTTRTQSTTRNQSNTNTKRTPGIQYTSEGLPILRVGLRGSEVVKLQQQLKKLGYLKGDVDGDFGATTEAAVKALQKRYGLEPDGVAGGATWEILLRR
ncbi:peptidoglycan-binding protein [Nostoc paludosum FACHB-159]|uniref:Peptidoglycan-binding protein n=2 Tax=Nostoc TaxID=1177 RepID=A0ABR8JYE0_9NOSO|nr:MULTISPECIES: peptidoglycan-binding domain-containing protein [Nostoc]MBD2676429.1 peptidoglycan-binding protein [Nostoc sp. FACHB-857]MBD2732439.1 peptidoglycan-binding protein [Nostoc paludosum FACHB-159]